MSGQDLWRTFATLVGVVLLGACRQESPRSACTSDLSCSRDEVCYLDGRCLPETIAARYGGVGVACGPDRPSCPADTLCQQRHCVGPGGVVEPPPDPNCPASAARPSFGGLARAFGETEQSVVLEWLPAAPAKLGDRIDYQIFRSLDGTWPSDATPIAAVQEQLRYEVTGLSSGVAASFGVRAVGPDGTADCNQVIKTVTPGPPPACLDYDQHIAPILERCTECHAGAGPPEWLALDRYEGVLAGSVRGNTIVACDPNRSWLIQKLSPQPPRGERMPKNGLPLTDGQVALLSRWVGEGARRSCLEPNPCVDTIRPTFSGLAAANPLDARTVELRFPVAEDQGTPEPGLRYDVYEATTPGGERYNEPPATTVTGALTVLRTIAPGTRLCWVVRARDLADNQDQNQVEECATTPDSDCALEYPEQVQPIFSARCEHCHGGPTPRRHLVLSSYEGMRAGGALRDTVLACQHNESVLGRKVSGRYCGERMPLDGPPYLSPAESSVIAGWANSGARRRCSDPDPCGDTVPPTFLGLSSARAVSESAVELCWTEASDDRTGAADLAYDIYEAAASGDQRFDRPAARSVAGASCFELPAVPERESCYVVRARDLAGHQDSNTVERCLTPPGACVDYSSRIQATFTARCIQCHSGGSAPQGLRLDSFANATQRQTAIRACAAGNSRIVQLVERCEMPRDTTGDRCDRTACLTPNEQGLVRAWIGQGASQSCPAEGCP